jgi:hypothetical protein
MLRGPGQCPTDCTLLGVAQPGSYRATFAFAMLSEEEAAACRQDAGACALKVNGSELAQLTVDFEFDGGAFELAIE